MDIMKYIIISIIFIVVFLSGYLILHFWAININSTFNKVEKIELASPVTSVGERVDTIGEIPFDSCGYHGVVFSPDGFHFACEGQVESKTFNTITTIGGLFGTFCFEKRNIFCYLLVKVIRPFLPPRFLILDGKKVSTSGINGIYDNIRNLIFSPNNKHFVYHAYHASKDSDGLFVLDGKEEKPYNSVRDFFTFSPDGEHYAYSANKGETECIVLDGKEFREHQYIHENPVLSLGGKHFAYTYGVGWHTLVVDGQEKGWFNYIRHLTFSPNGEHLAFITSTGKGGYYVKVDSKNGKEYDAIEKPIFSPDSQHIAYAAKEQDKNLIVLDDEVKKEFESAEIITKESELKRTDYLIFSPDSQHLAYIVQTVSKNGFNFKIKQSVFLDNENKYEYEEISPYKGIDSLAFSPDSKHLLFRVAKKTIIIDGKNFGEKYDNVYNPQFSSDGKYIIYNAQKNRIFYRVVEKIQ